MKRQMMNFISEKNKMMDDLVWIHWYLDEMENVYVEFEKVCVKYYSSNKEDIDESYGKELIEKFDNNLKEFIERLKIREGK